ncbi:Putative transposase (identified by ISEscan HMM) [Klebsiella pneumoniae]|nr:Putative transposase (identified by ISEscan HMM) [Klebsiella pneumoniae]
MRSGYNFTNSGLNDVLHSVLAYPNIGMLQQSVVITYHPLLLMELHMNPFKGRHFQRDIILWAVRWYCNTHQLP